jgi:hypothetical protein
MHENNYKAQENHDPAKCTCGEKVARLETVDISFESKTEICLKMTLADLQTLCDMTSEACGVYVKSSRWNHLNQKLKETCERHLSQG